MSDELHVENVGKAYRRWDSEWLRVASWLGLAMEPAEENWVLRNVSFTIGHGEAVGIIGQNGAGKSTLLKVITGTAQPSEGRVRRVGRVAAILELGMGFNPELTGRQNAFYSAGLMGYTQSQIEAIMPAIEAFSEIGEYFDQPVRTYSSGMQVRVAFSVATAFRPGILIIDEALSVGDAYFQHKSFSRIREFQEQGTSLLIVSHDRTAIQALCGRALLLEKGQVIRDGPPDEVMDFYNALIAERENNILQESEHVSGRIQIVSGTGEVFVESIGLHDESGAVIDHVEVGTDVELRIVARARTDIPRLVLGYMIKDRLGQSIFGTNTHHTEQAIPDVRAGQAVTYSIRFPMRIGTGTYSISTALVSTDTHLTNNYEWRDLALIFTVSNFQRSYFAGSAWLPPEISVALA